MDNSPINIHTCASLQYWADNNRLCY